MAAVTFASMVPDISAFLPGCPDLTIERTARKIVTDLCQRGKVWRDDLTPLTLVVSQEEYTPATTVAYAAFSDVLASYIVVNGGRKDLKWTSYDKVRRMFSQWPLGDDGEPTVVTSRVPGKIMFALTPDAAYVCYIYACLRPTPTADIWDADLYAEFHRAIFHGVLSELMALPNRSWTDAKAAMLHGRQWTYLLNSAKDRADRGFNVDSMSVEMRPFA
jgi:hypothetical protein